MTLKISHINSAIEALYRYANDLQEHVNNGYCDKKEETYLKGVILSLENDAEIFKQFKKELTK